MKINGIIFDFNGTLFFDSAYHFQAWNEIKKEITGEPLTEEELHKEYDGMPNVETLRKMSQGRFTKAECEAYSQKKEAIYRRLVSETPGGAHLCKGADELLALLREKHVPFTIASASIKENIDFFIEQFHLSQYMDTDLIVYDDNTYKDKTEMFLKAEEKIHVKENLLIFEDSLSGIRCAAEVGASLIVIDVPSLEKEYKKYPQILRRVKDMTEIEELIMY